MMTSHQTLGRPEEKKMSKPRLLLADDHTLLLEGYQKLLEQHFEIAGMVKNGRELVDAAVVLRPDVVLLDISMPQLNGLEATRQLRNLVPDCRIVIVTMHDDPEYIYEAFRAGASAYFLKQSAASELVSAIESVLRGSIYITPLMTADGRQTVRRAAGGRGRLESVLSPRQREVLQLVAEGRTGKEIASLLQISVKTVEFHKSSIFRHLGVRSIADMTRYAMKRGIVVG